MFGTYCRLLIHVYDSDITIIRAARLKIQKRFRTLRASRSARHTFYRSMLAHHRDARDTHRKVMCGE